MFIEESVAGDGAFKLPEIMKNKWKIKPRGFLPRTVFTGEESCLITDSFLLLLVKAFCIIFMLISEFLGIRVIKTSPIMTTNTHHYMISRRAKRGGN